MQNLFSNDRMIVKGRIFTLSNMDGTDVRHNLDILFVFQVNGKLVQHSCNMEVCSGTEFGLGDRLTLKNWNEWYNIEGLFNSMGYRFDSNELGGTLFPNSNSPMKRWIEQIEADIL